MGEELNEGKGLSTKIIVSSFKVQILLVKAVPSEPGGSADMRLVVEVHAQSKVSQGVDV